MDPPSASSHQLHRRRRAVESLCLRPALAGPALLAVGSSALGGNTWDGEVTLLGAPSASAAASGGSGSLPACAPSPLLLAELLQRDTVTAVAWAAGGGHLCVASDSGDVGVYAVPSEPARLGVTPARAVAALEYHDDIVACCAGVAGAPAAVVTASWDGV